MTQIHVDPPPIPLIKSKHVDKSDKDFVKLKIYRNPMSSSSEIYEFKMFLFDNGEPEKLLLFVQNFNVNLAASGTLATGTKIQYLCTLVREEVLRQFDSFSTDTEGMNTLTVETIILGLASYFFPVNYLSKQKCAMCRGMRKPRGLKLDDIRLS